jgi:hypothetical protein
MKHPIEGNCFQIAATPAIIAAIVLISLALGLPTARADGRVGSDAGGLAGSDVWFDTMRKLPANETLLLALAKTNYLTELPYDCVEVAGTITFPDGNPFAGDPLPELNISCRDRSVDAEVRVPKLDDAGHFYTVFKRGQTYEFYWKREGDKNRDKFCTLQVSADAQQRQKLAVPCTAKVATAVNPFDSAAEAPRDRAGISREYDMSGFPPKPTSAETRKIADAIKFGRSTSARAAAHEMLGRYYRDTKLDNTRAESEFKKAEALKTMSSE